MIQGQNQLANLFELCKIGYNVTVNQVSPQLAQIVSAKKELLSDEEKKRFEITGYDWRELSFTLKKDSFDMILFLGNNLKYLIFNKRYGEVFKSILQNTKKGWSCST